MLKALHRLSGESNGAHTSEVAVRLGVTPGTVTAGVKRLAERGFVIHRRYRGVELTPVGRQLAVSVIRRHRIVERFLSDMLGYAWQDADRLAMTFEHQLPQEVEDRLFATLGRPETCPHGFAIPEPQSSDLPGTLKLTDLELGDEAVVALSGDLASEVIEFLDSLGVRPGVCIELREKQPFHGPVVLRVEGIDRTVGEQLAERIRVIAKSKKSETRSADRVPVGEPPSGRLTAERSN